MKEKAPESEGHRGKVGPEQQQPQQQQQSTSAASSTAISSNSSAKPYKAASQGGRSSPSFPSPPKGSSTPKNNSPSVESKNPNNNNNFDDDYNEWDISIGDLIIDLDADIERQSEGNKDDSPEKGTEAAATSTSAASIEATNKTTASSAGMSSSFKSNRLTSAAGNSVAATSSPSTSSAISNTTTATLNNNINNTSSSATSAANNHSVNNKSTPNITNNTNNVNNANNTSTTSAKPSSLGTIAGAGAAVANNNLNNHGSLAGGAATTAAAALQRKSTSSNNSNVGGGAQTQAKASVGGSVVGGIPSTVAGSTVSSGTLTTTTTTAAESTPKVEHQAMVDKGLKMKIKRRSFSGKDSDAKHEIIDAEVPNKPYTAAVDSKHNSTPTNASLVGVSGGSSSLVSVSTTLASSTSSSTATSSLNLMTSVPTTTTTSGSSNNNNPSTSSNSVINSTATNNVAATVGGRVSPSMNNNAVNTNNNNHEVSSLSKSSKHSIKAAKLGHKKHDHKHKFDKDKLGLSLTKTVDGEENTDLESPSISSPNITMKYSTNSVISSDEASSKADKNEESISATKEVGTSTSIATITEPECLGPCEPGTSVTLGGIVWQETEGGVLVVNVTWRGKTYVGTLLDCTKHDWAPPRFCESPTSDIEAKLGTNTRGKRARISFNSDSVVDTRSTSKLRNGKGRRTANSGYVPPSPAKSDSSLSAKLAGKRKPKPNETDSLSGDDIKRNRPKLDTDNGGGISGTVDRCSSPTLIECPEPNCSKKYKHMNGLKYHQSHAHAGSSYNLNDSQDSEREKGKGDLSDGDYDDIADSPTTKEGSNDADEIGGGGGDKGADNCNANDSEVVVDVLDNNNVANNQGGDENLEKPPNSPSKFSDISDENDANLSELPLANNNTTGQSTEQPSEKMVAQQQQQHASNSVAPSHISPYSSFFNAGFNNFNQTKTATDKGKLGKGEENNSETSSAFLGNNTNNLNSHYPNYPGFFQPFGPMGKTAPPPPTSAQDGRHGKPNELESNFGNSLAKPENKLFSDPLKQPSKDNEFGLNKPPTASSLLELQNLKNRVPNIGFDQMDTNKRMAMFEAERLKLKEQLKQSQPSPMDTNKVPSRPKEEKDKKRPDEGVKPTMETTGPPPPTNGYYYNPSFLSSPFSPFDFRSSAMNHMLNSSYGPPGFPTHPSQMRFPMDGLPMPGNAGPGNRLPPTSQSSNGNTSMGPSGAPPGGAKPPGSMHHHKHSLNPNTGKHDRTSIGSSGGGGGGGGNPSSMPVSSHSMMPPGFHHKSSPNKSEHSSASSSAPAYVNSPLMSVGSNPSPSQMHPPTQPRHPHYSIYDPYSMMVNQSMHPFSTPK